MLILKKSLYIFQKPIYSSSVPTVTAAEYLLLAYLHSFCPKIIPVSTWQDALRAYSRIHQQKLLLYKTKSCTKLHIAFGLVELT